MLVFRDGKAFLSIFTNFEIDYNLPKHQKLYEAKEEAEDQKMSAPAEVGEFRRQRFNVNATWNVTTGQIGGITTSTSVIVQPPTLWDRILAHFGYVKGQEITKTEIIEEKPTKTADLVFECVIKNDEQIQAIGAKIDKFKTMIEQAHLLGQKALEEELRAKWNIYCCEAQLIANQVTKVISEERLIEFVSGCQKGLRLDWIKNFIRIIPSELAQKKLDIDKLCIFDNYVVLHYDPENKNNQWTKEEIQKELERRKDPILFGVIDGSNKLYYIGDWKDEYCDLTWDAIAEKIEEKHLRIE